MSAINYNHGFRLLDVGEVLREGKTPPYPRSVAGGCGLPRNLDVGASPSFQAQRWNAFPVAQHDLWAVRIRPRPAICCTTRQCARDSRLARYVRRGVSSPLHVRKRIGTAYKNAARFLGNSEEIVFRSRKGDQVFRLFSVSS